MELIKWLDHYSQQGWQEIPTECVDYEATTVGFNVYEDDKYVVLAQSNAAHAVGDLMHILKVNITDRKKLRVR